MGPNAKFKHKGFFLFVYHMKGWGLKPETHIRKPGTLSLRITFLLNIDILLLNY